MDSHSPLGGPFNGPEDAFHAFLRARDSDPGCTFEAFQRLHPLWAGELGQLHSEWLGLEQARERMGLGAGAAEAPEGARSRPGAAPPRGAPSSACGRTPRCARATASTRRSTRAGWARCVRCGTRTCAGASP